MIFLYILLTLVLMTVVVAAHEYGHLWVARRNGMVVEEFSVGFGKRIWSRERSGIRWSLKLLPLGGSVRIAGMSAEEVDERGLPRDGSSYAYASAWKRAKVALAGVTVNLLLAWVALTAVAVALSPIRWSTILFAPIAAFLLMGGLATEVVRGIGQVVVHGSSPNMGSILSAPTAIQEGMVAYSSTLSAGMYVLLAFGLINLSLAVANLLPLAPLDGYQAFVAGVDGARSVWSRRQMPPLRWKQLRWASIPSMLLLFGLAGMLFAGDITKMMA